MSNSRSMSRLRKKRWAVVHSAALYAAAEPLGFYGAGSRLLDLGCRLADAKLKDRAK